MIETLEQRFQKVAPQDVDACSLRYVRERSDSVWVRQDILQPVETSEDEGVMITVQQGGGLGYGATSDLSEAGLRKACERARGWAERSAGKSVVDFAQVPVAHARGDYQAVVERPWESTSLGEKIDLLRAQCSKLKTDERIVDWSAGLARIDMETFTLTTGGGRLRQRFHYVFPTMRATANEGSETQSRTFRGWNSLCRQGGLEVIDAVGFHEAPTWIAADALALLTAPNCPKGTMDVLLAPDQMILQIHESIGHPLELDRILGDERNYAGTSFVTMDMFGSHRYGSDLLNVTFDPTRPEQLASYGFDDDGTPAQKEFIIKEGILQRPLGGATSQARAGVAGVANARACSWNRPPIDRMANLNLEPGDSSFKELLAPVERGVFMRTNCSWSIDDSRNKFQFGCEWGRLIEDGKLTTLVKKPNYRGISESFWRNLKMVGDESTLLVMGTPNCGKGEPNQVIRVGHASPTCLFADVEVFGGAE